MKLIKSIAASLVLGLASISPAHAVATCTIPFEVTSSADSCEFGGLVFGDWQLSLSNATIEVFFGTGSSATDNTVYIRFQLTNANNLLTGDNSGDVILEYSVSALYGSLVGIDNALGSTSGFVSIIENAYDSEDNEIGSLITSKGGAINIPTAEDFFDQGFSQIFIRKDISWSNTYNTDQSVKAYGAISDFTNSHHWVPEPGSLALLGLGLLGLGFARRRKQG